MPIPDYQTLMLPVLQKSAQGEVKISQVISEITDEYELTDDEKAELLPSGKQTIIANRVHWAKTYLKQAGLVDATRRGHFRISDRGKAVLSENPQRIDNTTLNQFSEFISFKNKASSSDEPVPAVMPTETSTPDETLRTAYRDIEDTLRQELIERIRAANPAFFEQLIVNLLVEMGYGGSIVDAGRALGKSGDEGIDGVIDQDALGLDRVYIQAKRYAEGKNVGSSAIRDFFGSLDRFKATKGLFVTTSEFSAGARETANLLSKRIVLIDGDTLTRLMVRYNVGCRVEETLHLRKLDEDFFSEAD